MAPESRSRSYWRQDPPQSPALAQVYPPASKRCRPPEQAPSEYRASRRPVCGTSTATNFPDRTDAASPDLRQQYRHGQHRAASDNQRHRKGDTAEQRLLEFGFNALFASVSTCAGRASDTGCSASARSMSASAWRKGSATGTEMAGILKTLALFNRHFRREDTRFCLLQLLRGDAPLNTVCPCFSTTTLTPSFRPAFRDIPLPCRYGRSRPDRR